MFLYYFKIFNKIIVYLNVNCGNIISRGVGIGCDYI